MTRTRGLTSSVRWIDRFQLWIDRFQLLLTGAVGRYNHGLKAILLDQRYVSGSTSSSEIAATVVHEANARTAGPVRHRIC